MKKTTKLFSKVLITATILSGLNCTMTAYASENEPTYEVIEECGEHENESTFCVEAFESEAYEEVCAEPFEASIDENLEMPLEEVFDDDGSHYIIERSDDGITNVIEDSITSREEIFEDNSVITIITYESGASTTSTIYISDDSCEEVANEFDIISETTEEDTFVSEITENYEETTLISDIVSSLSKVVSNSNDGLPEENDIVFGSFLDESGKCTINWTYDKTTKKLTIKSDTPGAIIPWVNTNSNLEWSKYQNEVTKISIEGNISQIKSGSFRNFSSLEKVFMNRDVTYVTSYAFSGCSKLTILDINGNPETNEDFFSNLGSNCTISCHYSTDANSMYKRACHSICNVNPKSGVSTCNMDDVDCINQMDSAIYNMSSGNEKWTNTACFVSSCAMMIERYAANNDYEGVYSQEGGVELIREISNEQVLVKGTSFQWTKTEQTYDGYTKDGKNLDISLTHTQCGGSEERYESSLKALLEVHPEGVMIVQDKGTKKGAHAVLVTGYNPKTNLFKVWDPGNGLVSERTFRNLNGYSSTESYHLCYISKDYNK